MDIITNLERMLSGGQDNALLRFSLGNAYFQQKAYTEAIYHLQESVKQDSEYSAAWKILGRAQLDNDLATDAAKTFTQGIEIAEKKGDIQAAKEMKVFLKRAMNKD